MVNTSLHPNQGLGQGIVRYAEFTAIELYLCIYSCDESHPSCINAALDGGGIEVSTLYASWKNN